MWARGLKCIGRAILGLFDGSRPVWARGLKWHVPRRRSRHVPVASRVGAGIEIAHIAHPNIWRTVASRVGAGIEMLPLDGIETPSTSRPVWARGLKSRPAVGRAPRPSRVPCGRGD